MCRVIALFITWKPIFVTLCIYAGIVKLVYLVNASILLIPIVGSIIDGKE
jgi:hypothetical protein